MKNHGQSPESIERVKQKLFQLKIRELVADDLEYDIDVSNIRGTYNEQQQELQYRNYYFLVLY